MDYIILNNDGSIASLPSLVNPKLKRYIQQGNSGVDKIFIGWPLGLSTDYGQAVFTLANQLTNTVLGVFKENYPYEADDPDNPPSDYDGETCNGWVITLTSDQTIYNGGLFVSFRVIRNGIVQVAFPFTLMINETGVRPDTDSGVTIDQLDSYLLNIQNLVTNAVRQNTDAALSTTSENPVQNKVITTTLYSAIAGVYKVGGSATVQELEDLIQSEQLNGYVYNCLDAGTLYNYDETEVEVQEGDNVVFIWNDGEWHWDRMVGFIDTSHLVTTDTNQDITAEKTFEDVAVSFYYSGVTGDAKWHIKEDTYGRLAFSRTYNGIETTYWNFDGSSMIPNQTNTNSIGSSNRYLKEMFVNKVHSGNLSFKVFDAPENTLVFTDEMMTELMNGGIVINGKLYNLNIYNPILFKGTYTSTNDVWGIIIYSAQANGELQEIAMYRIPQSTKQFSIATYDWINLKNIKSVDFGNNATITKDSSNRVNINNNGVTKIKVGQNETYFANHVEPDSNNTYTLGRAGVKWLTTYTRYINDDEVNIAVHDIGKKLYKHSIFHPSGIGVPLLIIISTDSEPAEDVAGVNRLLSGNGYVNAFCQQIASLNNPQEIWQIYSYLFTESTVNSLDLRYIKEDSSNNLRTFQFLLNDVNTTTDTVSPMN